MSGYTGRVVCPNCQTETSGAAIFAGCSRCAADGSPVNVHPEFDIEIDVRPDVSAPGIFRHRRLLPLPEGIDPVSLEEGNTPLLRLSRLGTSVGLANLYLKDESRNPTWSYKDRLAAVAVTRARADGADTVVVGTTGNHGAAAAAYAAAAGLRCVVLTLTSVPLTMKVLMQVYGAEVVAVSDSADRWTVMREAVGLRGWVPLSGLTDPPVGSNPYGIEGYKTIAYELVEQLSECPDIVVVPVAYGDGLIGIHRGFQELLCLGKISHLPRLVAAEPLGPYWATLQSGSTTPQRVGGGTSVAFSVASTVATAQGVRALRESDGTAVVVGDDAEILDAQRRLASAGCYLEPSAAICLPAVERLVARKLVSREAVVVMIGTSGGLKDIEATAATLPQVPLIEPNLAALEEALVTQ
ncbi:MAG: pyridoxal-phosphate dependent enzyme [Acidimicrobiia bacterium]|nr:pyridoxal-phosphate dependent enzyme [Acidimicrobiia bacterium]MDH3398076.1 pyridoxal-phosphate dependent enzyme [Acidimicrobiia bacterium]